MIIINVFRDNKNNVYKFTVEGHAYAEEPGKDIVCASVSILTQTTVLSLYEIIDLDVMYEIRDGWLSCQIPKDIETEKRLKGNIVIETMLLGLKGIIEMYPKYVKIYDKEV